MKAELDAVVQEKLEHWADQIVLRRDNQDIQRLCREIRAS